MKKYFYSNGQEKEGPFTLEELKAKNILPKTLIWHEGLEDWQEATNIEELKELFELSPPPVGSKEETLFVTDTLEPEPMHQGTGLFYGEQHDSGKYFLESVEEDYRIIDASEVCPK
jgi:hypothetical protein